MENKGKLYAIRLGTTAGYLMASIRDKEKKTK